MVLYLITFMTLVGFVMTSNTTTESSTIEMDIEGYTKTDNSTLEMDIEGPDLRKANISQMKNLIDSLLKDYNKDILPTNNFMETFQIEVQPLLFAIGDLDEVEEKMSSVLLMHYSWYDDSMVWNSSLHNGIDNVTIDSNLMWKPVFQVVNMHHSTRPASTYVTKVRYHTYGIAVWTQIQLLDTTCSLDTTYFPFDVQTCHLNLTLSDDGAYNIKVVPVDDGTHLFFFENNGAWRLHEYIIKGGNYSALDITYVIHRRPLFIIVNVLLPIIVLAFLTPLVFLLPKGSGERIGYTVTILLAISVYMTILSDNLPANSDPMPNLTILLLMFYIITGLTILVVILNNKVLKTKEVRPVPLFAKRLVALVHCSWVTRSEQMNKTGSLATEYLGEEESCLHNDEQIKEGATTRGGLSRQDIGWSDVSNAIDMISLLVVFTSNVTMFSLFFGIAYAGHGTLSLES